jgi:hypothetical protein
MRELRKIGNLKVRLIPYMDSEAKREDIIRVTVSVAKREFKTRINLEDVQLDWQRIKEALRTFVAALPA